MADKTEKEPKVKQKKGRSKGPKLVVGDFPYVSLMPANRLNAIEVEEAKTKWIKTVGAGIVIAVVIAVASVGFKIIHQIGYDGAKQDAAAVEASILKFGEVDDALTIKSSIEGEIIEGTANTINWQDIQNRIAQNLPTGSSITTFNVNTGGTESDENSVSVFVNVSSIQPIAYAQILDSFGKVPGLVPDTLLIGDLTSLTQSSDVVYSYPVAFSIDGSILSQRWKYLTDKDAPKQDAPTAIEEEPLPVPVPDPTEQAEDSE